MKYLSKILCGILGAYIGYFVILALNGCSWWNVLFVAIPGILGIYAGVSSVEPIIIYPTLSTGSSKINQSSKGE